jgi:hypothetical protein
MIKEPEAPKRWPVRIPVVTVFEEPDEERTVNALQKQLERAELYHCILQGNRICPGVGAVDMADPLYPRVCCTIRGQSLSVAESDDCSVYPKPSSTKDKEKDKE